MGVPAITAEHDDTSKVIKPDNGFLFEIDNKLSLAQVIREACVDYNNGALVHKGEKARDAIVKDHQWVSRVRNLMDFIESREEKRL